MSEEQQDQYFNDHENRETIMQNPEYFAGRVGLEVPETISNEWLDLAVELNIAMNREEQANGQ